MGSIVLINFVFRIWLKVGTAYYSFSKTTGEGGEDIRTRRSPKGDARHSSNKKYYFEMNLKVFKIMPSPGVSALSSPIVKTLMKKYLPT